MQSEQETARPEVVRNFPIDVSENQRARIGLKLGEIRQSRNIPQDEAARLIGISRSHLSNIEVGRSRPGWSRLMAMATVYEIPIDTLLREVSEHGDDLPMPPRPQRRQKARKADGEDRARSRLRAPQRVALAGRITAQSSMQGSVELRTMVGAALNPWEVFVVEAVTKLPEADRRRAFALLMEQIRASLET